MLDILTFSIHLIKKIWLGIAVLSIRIYLILFYYGLMNLLIIYQIFLLILSTLFWVGVGVKLHPQSHSLNDFNAVYTKDLYFSSESLIQFYIFDENHVNLVWPKEKTSFDWLCMYVIYRYLGIRYKIKLEKNRYNIIS